MIGEILAAMIGTVSFSLLFGVPRREYPWCGLIGGAGWAVYLLASQKWTDSAAVLTAAMVVVFLSRMAAVAKECPVTIFLISGIFPLVPGAGVYWTVYYMAVKTAVAIVLGIVFVFELPQGLFRFMMGKRGEGPQKAAP